jgi:Zn-dependent oligopeptidase
MAGSAAAQTSTHSTTTSSAKTTTTKSTTSATKSTSGTASKSGMPGRFFTGRPNAAKYRQLSTQELDLARADLKRLLAVKGKRTIQNTLTVYSTLTLHADNASSWAGLMESVHPDSAFRSTAEAMSQDASKFFTELGLNRQVYDALQAVDVNAADPTRTRPRGSRSRTSRRSWSSSRRNSTATSGTIPARSRWRPPSSTACPRTS